MTYGFTACILAGMPTAKRRNIPNSVLEEADTVLPEAVQALWSLWKAVHTSGKGRGHQLSSRRAQDISVAVVAYGFEACVRAIIGAYFSPFHMGDNKALKRYTNIELILRYGEKWRVAKFGKLYLENKQDAEELRRQHLVDYRSLTVVEEIAEEK